MTGNPTPPPLGRLLVERGLITERELEQALARSAETGKHLGDTILELDLVPPSEIMDLLAVQRAWRPLGWMLVERGLLTGEQLADCLDDSQTSGRRLGDVVRARGLVSNHALETVLHEQYELEIELERGFGGGLRGEIERRYRIKRAHGEPHHEEADPTPPLFGFELPTVAAAPPRPSAPAQPGHTRRADEQAEEIRRLRQELAARDATIAALRQRLGDADPVAV